VQAPDLERGETPAVLVEKDLQAGEDIVIDGILDPLDLDIDRHRGSGGDGSRKKRASRKKRFRQDKDVIV